jgi:hypothetical protein
MATLKTFKPTNEQLGDIAQALVDALNDEMQTCVCEHISHFDDGPRTSHEYAAKVNETLQTIYVFNIPARVCSECAREHRGQILVD